ncbi:MAG: HNH endonuclease domain-containing protein [Minicystis sp.]
MLLLPDPDPDRGALRLAERLIQLLDRGGFTATYKYAVLVALIDLCLEHTSSKGEPPSMVTTRQMAEKIIELYWPHCAPYLDDDRLPERAPRVLHQSTARADKQALIVRHVLDFREIVDPRRERSLSLVRARLMAEPDHYERLVDLVEWTLINMPLPRLQYVGREEDRFLYEYNFTKETPRGVVERYQRGEKGRFDNRLNLQPGVGMALIALNGVLRPLIYRSWTTMVATMNGLAQSELEDFLFGKKRISLEPVQPGLVELQQGLCFYCKQGMPTACEVDHFVPWARHADNSIENLVATHKGCNGQKSDFLAAAEHVERWRERSVQHEGALADLARQHRWESRPERTLSVARAIYGMLPDDAKLWRLGREFISLERQKINEALAA